MTMHHDRPDPDELLKQIQSEEQARRRGQLKIFLGYAAGVGKTYAMLEAARQRKEEGVDIVISYIETHKRAETEAMVADLEVLPRKTIDYHGFVLTEMDVDAVIARQPILALVDELAHTNAPGSRHPKRYQDVQELLDAGINVYTTLNIQHLESLNDVVAQITGVVVHETIPDSVIDEASEIELIDLPPDELLTRLQEGKVYIPEQAARAIREFFRKGNLTALREMTLRRAAERVDDQMRSYMQARAIPGPWPAGERLLACISPSPLSERLIRSARRLATELKAEWLTVYVETPQLATISPEKRDRVAGILRQAEELGARTYIIGSRGSVPDVAQTILDFARKNNVSKIMLGKPLRPRWQEILRGSVVEELTRLSGDIDIYVVTSSDQPSLPPEDNPLRIHSPLSRYLWSLLLVVIATALGFLIGGRIEPTNLVMLYLLTVVIAAIYLGRGPAVLASLLGVLAFDFLFVQPYFTFAVSDTQYIITFIGLFMVGIVISQLTARAREQADAAQEREAETAELYALSRDLAVAGDLDSILRVLVQHVEQTFGRNTVVLLPENDHLITRVVSSDLKLAEDELAVADWVFRHGDPAGRHTNTLPAAQLRYLPLRTARGILGVLGVQGPQSSAQHLTPQQRRLMETFASQAALAIERVQLTEQARQAQLLQATEKLQTALLNSISHDLRTPLVSITGALTSLDEQALDEKYRKSLIVTAREEADRLNRLVGNLLSMTRIESGAIKLRLEPGDIQDMIGTALDQLDKRVANRKVLVNVPDDFPLVPLDFSLMVQVLVNVLDNAVKYSPEYCSIEVSAELVDNIVSIKIADRGEGIPPEDLTRIFDKFYRVQRPESVSGTGLGLSISKGIIEAHGAQISAHNRDGGGTIVIIELPLNGGRKQDNE
jgi:two-component system sensor histidine kinase KdpD